MSTPVLYKEAATMLGLDTQRIRLAVSNGTLTQVPNRRYTQAVYKEQVELFIRKPRLSKHALSPEERKEWEAVEASVNPSTQVNQSVHSTQSEHIPPATPIYLTDRAGLEYMNDRGVSMKVATPAGEMIFQPALPDEIDSDDIRQAIGELSTSTILAILVGLFILFFALSKGKKAAKLQAEQTIKQIGLEREDLETSQRKTVADLISRKPEDKSITALRSHPKEALELKTLLKREKVLP
jgi:hypothetical protein